MGIKSEGHNPCLAVVVTHAMTAGILLKGQLRALGEAGFQVHLLCSPGPEVEGIEEREGVVFHPVPMARGLGGLGDLVALSRLYRAFKRIRPAIVNAGTPKASLLGMLAARRAEVPNRVHTLRGLRLETTNGVKRRLLARAERMTARAAHGTVCVSESLKKRFLELELSRADKTVVLGSGSSNGVDVERFRPRVPEEVADLRQGLGIPPDAPVVGFVGRLIKAKGIEDLVEALEALEQHVAGVHLLLVGDFEDGDPVSPSVRGKIGEHPRIHATGFVEDTAPYYGLLDVLALPSYREGFPNVALEAAASAIPVAGYAATGTTDAVADGVTGTLVPVGDVVGLGVMLEPYLAIPERRQRHGEAARVRVVEEFRQELVWQRWVDLYNRLLAEQA